MKSFFAALFLCACVAAAREQPAGYYLVDNFTAALPGNASISCDTDSAAKVGLGCARLTYKLEPKQRSVNLAITEGSHMIPASGTLKMWVKGDGSGNELELLLMHARPKIEPDGKRHYQEHAGVNLKRVKLDFDEWRELSFDVPAIPEGHLLWWHQLAVHLPNPNPKGPEPKMSGTLLLDDMRLYPSAGSPSSTLNCGVLGPAAREFKEDISIFADVRNFKSEPARVRVRVTMTDRNSNMVVDRDFTLDLAAGESREAKLELKPEKLDAFLPPFKIGGDVLSNDLPEVSFKLDQTLVMGNSTFLFDDFSNVYGRWFTSGTPMSLRTNIREWFENWTHGERQRASAYLQTTARISRVDAPQDAGAGGPGTGKNRPGRYAMQLDYTGDAVVYTGIDRLLPGDAYRLGVWVKGDGSGAKLSALILDYTNGQDFWYGGWRRIRDSDLTLCKLDFTDWRYVELNLPGNGVGSNTMNGSTEQIDFPLELTAFHIETATGQTNGSVQFGPIFVHTQQAAAASGTGSPGGAGIGGALSLQVGYDDPSHFYAPQHNASMTVQNAWQIGRRKLKSIWTLFDAAGDKIAGGVDEFELAAGELKLLKADLASHAEEIAKRRAPLKFQTLVTDTADPSISALREIMLARPDSTVSLDGFEGGGQYLDLKADDPRKPPGEFKVAASGEQAHSGKMSLPLAWEKAKRERFTVSIGTMPGVPCELSMWIYGDGSGVALNPLLGSAAGVRHGASQINYFYARNAEGDLQDGVRVDWTGWRQVTFRLPPIPTTWEYKERPLAFLPSYPMGLHLSVSTAGAKTESGKIFVDDITVKTHLPPPLRLSLAGPLAGNPNVIAPSGTVNVTIANFDSATRKATLSGGLYDWRGKRIAGIEQALELKSVEHMDVAIAKNVPPGAFVLQATLTENNVVVGTLEDDVLSADLAPTLGENWQTAIQDEWKLRAPVKEKFTYLDEDWDWVEHHPGNVQLDTIRQRASIVKDANCEPYILIGFSAYWASGVGFEQMKAGAFSRRQRDVGHAVDIFMIPQNIEDWDNYVCELMRGVGKEVSGWIVWDNPDSVGPMRVDPAQFAKMLQRADKWRRIYCPQTPLLIGGMARGTAIPYLNELKSHEALECISGVQLRLDVGRLSPEDAEIVEYVRELKAALVSGSSGPPKIIQLADFDWAVERDPLGLTVFDQAAYLARAAFLLEREGVTSALSIRNGDFARVGLGLVYKPTITVQPATEKAPVFHLKPAWWGVARARQWLEKLKPAGDIVIQDVIPGRTRCLLYDDSGKSAAIIWRNDDAGECSFAQTGLTVEAAEDMLGTPLPLQDGWYSIGKMPAKFVLKNAAEPVAQALGRLNVRGPETSAPQTVLAVFAPANGQRQMYEQKGGEPVEAPARTIDGRQIQTQSLRFKSGGSERFSIDVPANSDVLLRKTYLLDDTGHEAEVFVNAQPAGKWNLRRSEQKLSGGLREAVFILDRKILAGKTPAQIEIRYAGAANTVSWCATAFTGNQLALSNLGAIHADQNVSCAHIARNIVGAPLKIGTAPFANGIGAFAQSLLEYPLNGQFTRFTAKVGVDAVTEGRGSVVFEIYADGKKRWSSPVMSGLDQPREVDLDIKGVDRLRLIVSDAGDGNKFDAADWCEPILHR